MKERMTKPFDQEAYDKYDKPAKYIVRKWLDSQGFYTFINPIEDYGADIFVIRVVNGITMPIEAHEVEVKEEWTGGWPKAWTTLHILRRKKRLLEMYNFIFFWIISGDYKRAVMVDGKHVRSLILELVKNKMFPKGEYMYCVPIDLCSHVNLEKFKEKK